MTDSKEPDHIGEVIAEDVAKRRVCHICVSAPRVEACPVCDPPSFSELRQQLADVSNELDNLRQLSVTNILLDVVPGADGMGHEIYAGSVSAVQLIMDTQEDEIESLQLRLNASEARNKLLEVRCEVLDFVLREIATYKGRTTVGELKQMAKIGLNRVAGISLAQSAPATDEQGAD